MLKLKSQGGGFTLAELLITVAIIGIIGALVIPSMVDNYYKSFYLTAFKKKYKVFSDAVNLSTLENGKTKYWDTSLTADNFFQKYFGDYISLSECDDCWTSSYTNTTSTASTTVSTGIAANYTRYYLTTFTPNLVPTATYYTKDGATVGFSYGKSVTIKYNNVTYYSSEPILYIYIDVNADKSPNMYGYDRFVLQVFANELTAYGEGLTDYGSKKFSDYCKDTISSTYERYRMKCGGWIVENSWTYPEGYPGT